MTLSYRCERLGCFILGIGLQRPVHRPVPKTVEKYKRTWAGFCLRCFINCNAVWDLLLDMHRACFTDGMYIGMCLDKLFMVNVMSFPAQGLVKKMESLSLGTSQVIMSSD